MELKSLKLKNYKNISDCTISNLTKINCFVGNNGAGKTNIIDSVYFLTNTRSFFNHIDIQNIKFNENYLFLEGFININEVVDEVNASFSIDSGKIFKTNKKKHKKLADYYGTFPSVMITPYDIDLIHDASLVRRSFVDSVISLYDKEYLNILTNYNKVLLHRNSLLKSFFEKRTYENELLSIWDYKIINLSDIIYQKRQNFLSEFLPFFQNYYTYISEKSEIVTIEYKSDLNENKISYLLQKNITKDIASQRTNFGIHKDDFVFNINYQPMKKFASQGQQKTFVIALKFAQSDFIKKQTNIKPFLLLDDIFDKLDVLRVKNVVKLVAEEHFGQIFITHTDIEKLENILKPVGVNYSVYFVDNGSAKQNNF